MKHTEGHPYHNESMAYIMRTCLELVFTPKNVSLLWFSENSKSIMNLNDWCEHQVIFPHNKIHILFHCVSHYQPAYVISFIVFLQFTVKFPLFNVFDPAFS